MHDDTAAIQAAVAASAAVFFPQGGVIIAQSCVSDRAHAGIYVISAPIVLRSDSILVGHAYTMLSDRH